MKVIKIDLPQDLLLMEIHTFADEHIGDEHCDMRRLHERIEYIKNNPHAYFIMNGDILDNATKTSVGDTYTQELNPMEQLKLAVELFDSIKHKCLCVTHGNHENRTYRQDGINMSYLIAKQLGLEDRYTPTSAVLFLRFGTMSRGLKETNGSGRVRKICYTIYVLHGSGGGRKEGSKVIRLADMASIIDTDIYLHSHTHLGVIMRQAFHRIDTSNSAVALVDKLFVNTSANLNYGGYGEAGEFKPSSKKSPIIYLNGVKKEFEAKL